LPDPGSDNAKDVCSAVRYDSMMTSDPLKDAIETALHELRTQQENALHGLRESLIGASGRQREAAISEARAVAEAVAAERLEEALAKARADTDEAQAAADAIAAEKLSEALAEVQANADQMQTAAEAAAAERLIEAVAQVRADSERALAESRFVERQAGLAGVSRLLAAVRDFDRARSLSEILDALADHVSRETPRVAVLLVQGDQLRGWRFAGFGDQVPDARSVNLPLRDPTGGVVLKAVRTRAPSPTIEGHDDPADAAPSFAPLGPGRTGLAVPVEVGGRVVAVIYADDQADAPRTMPSVWPEAVEILARHAARCLETVTAVKARAVPLPSGHDEPAAAASPGPPEPHAAAGNGQDEAARRYAKLLVSEIRLYHESAVTAGRRERNLFERLSGEIERARGLFNARIPTAARADHFNQELIRTLADGDPALLGHPL
jgi:hypothetical protein